MSGSILTQQSIAIQDLLGNLKKQKAKSKESAEKGTKRTKESKTFTPKVIYGRRPPATTRSLKTTSTFRDNLKPPPQYQSYYNPFLERGLQTQKQQELKFKQKTDKLEQQIKKLETKRTETTKTEHKKQEDKQYVNDYEYLVQAGYSPDKIKGILDTDGLGIGIDTIRENKAPIGSDKYKQIKDLLAKANQGDKYSKLKLKDYGVYDTDLVSAQLDILEDYKPSTTSVGSLTTEPKPEKLKPITKMEQDISKQLKEQKDILDELQKTTRAISVVEQSKQKDIDDTTTSQKTKGGIEYMVSEPQQPSLISKALSSLKLTKKSSSIGTGSDTIDDVIPTQTNIRDIAKSEKGETKQTKGGVSFNVVSPMEDLLLKSQQTQTLASKTAGRYKPEALEWKETKKGIKYGTEPIEDILVDEKIIQSIKSAPQPVRILTDDPPITYGIGESEKPEPEN